MVLVRKAFQPKLGQEGRTHTYRRVGSAHGGKLRPHLLKERPQEPQRRVIKQALVSKDLARAVGGRSLNQLANEGHVSGVKIEYKKYKKDFERNSRNRVQETQLSQPQGAVKEAP